MFVAVIRIGSMAADETERQFRKSKLLQAVSKSSLSRHMERLNLPQRNNLETHYASL